MAYEYVALGLPLNTNNLDVLNTNWIKIKADISSLDSRVTQSLNYQKEDYTKQFKFQRNEYIGLINSQSSRIDNIVNEISNTAFQEVVNAAKVNWKSPVPTFNDLLTTYPEAIEGDTAQTLDDNKTYRYDGTDWMFIQSFGSGPFTDVYEKLEGQKYFVSSSSLGVTGDGSTDQTTPLQNIIDSMLGNEKELFLFGVFVVTEPIVFKGNIRGGTIILKEDGKVIIEEFAKVDGLKVLVHSSCVAPEAVLFEKKESSLTNFTLSSTSGIIKNMVGVRFKGTAVTCFDLLTYAHVRYCSTGIFIDSSNFWVTNIELDHVRVDYFEDYAIRVGSTVNNIEQNSQHNISNITIQDTADTEGERIGLSLGDTWSNYSNIVTFGDSPSGTFTPLHMPVMPNDLPELIRVTRANTLNGMVLEGVPNCNGYEYLHDLNGVRMLRHETSFGTDVHFTVPDTKPRTNIQLSENPTIRIPQNIIDDLITPGNITYTYTNGVVSIKNNTGVDLYFSLDVKLPTNVRNDLKNGKFSTVLLRTNMNNSTAIQNRYVCSLRNTAGTNLDIENIGHIGVTGKGQISFMAFNTSPSVLAAANSGDVYVRVGFTSVPAGVTYTIQELQFYNQLVPSLNHNNLNWLDESVFS